MQAGSQPTLQPSENGVPLLDRHSETQTRLSNSSNFVAVVEQDVIPFSIPKRKISRSLEHLTSGIDYSPMEKYTGIARSDKGKMIGTHMSAIVGEWIDHVGESNVRNIYNSPWYFSSHSYSNILQEMKGEVDDVKILERKSAMDLSRNIEKQKVTPQFLPGLDSTTLMKGMDSDSDKRKWFGQGFLGKPVLRTKAESYRYLMALDS